MVPLEMSATVIARAGSPAVDRRTSRLSTAHRLGNALLFHELVSGPRNAIPCRPLNQDHARHPTTLYSEGNRFNFPFVQVVPVAAALLTSIADV